MKHNILIVHPIKEFSGSLKSLEEYLKILKKKYNFYFLVPTGVASKRLKKFGKVIDVSGLSKFDNSQIGYYRKLRWLLILREILLIIPTFLSVYLIKKKLKKIDLIHFNEITLIPTIYIFKLFFNVPFILHCRILFKKNNYFGKQICKFLKKNINDIIAIDSDVKESLPNYLKINIIHNIIHKKKINKFNKNYNELRIGYIGSYLKFKGLENLITTVTRLKLKKFKIRLFLAGNFIKQNPILNLFKLTNNIDKKLLIKDGVTNLGHINNLENFYKQINIICFPSFLNALGRQVFEAAYFKIPSIVCLDKAKSDSFINKKTGISYKDPNSQKNLEKSIKYFYYNKNKIKIMGENAYRLVNKKFHPKKNIEKLNKLYQRNLLF